ncbi:4Fe-4S dicluster domain-containing protein [Aliiglaciecola sp. LCG003]|uniref:4Fe-4S dicluster domain-containing protein n=1 Tax=Aliiglaciecola sp. LCG003 TaxID=3053655 RepID=UPI002573B1D7|nr:4Fe-4S dicluster domain-containing protein [Aliiglaciecola sp. LCG003]WJG07693.1 4Fe-4S dicluster domain-containing protein [Aliiglaciecola sp. LCG003]
MISQLNTTKPMFYLNSIEQLVSHLANDHTVFQIQQDADGESIWSCRDNHSGHPLYGPHNLPQGSPKGMLFAEKEPLYKFDGETFQSIIPKVEPQVLFGVQACDLTAIAYQDKFFQNDPHYQTRREQTLLVGIDCDGPCENGFCTVVNAGPHVNPGQADIILSQLEVDLVTNQPIWLLVAESQKGLKSIAAMQLPSAGQSKIHDRSELLEKVRLKFDNFSYIRNSIEYINDKTIPIALWEQMSVQCLGCSGCSNLCPTCSCYSTYEINSTNPSTLQNEFTTYRNWDSCLYEGFQKEASGHNPSHAAAKRVERFWFHKFSDEYLPEFGRYGCVGCGRCESTCPGVIGVHSVMKRIDQACCN